MIYDENPDWFPFLQLIEEEKSLASFLYNSWSFFDFLSLQGCWHIQGNVGGIHFLLSIILRVEGFVKMQQLQLITSPHCPCNNDFLTTVQLRGVPPLLAF